MGPGCGPKRAAVTSWLSALREEKDAPITLGSKAQAPPQYRMDRLEAPARQEGQHQVF